ncbi:MAG: glycosyltransferase [Bacteroidales bacterium]|nr:glycosyltransferase [Bacteroidales bacterium]
MNSKRILIFFPHNLSEIKTGVHRRFTELVKYFVSRNFSIELLTLKNYEDFWPEHLPLKFLPEFENIYFYDHSKGLKHTFIRPLQFYELVLTNYFSGLRSYKLPDYSFPGLKRLLQNILKSKTYQYVLISYIQWAHLIDQKLPCNPKTIITIEDLLSINTSENKKTSGVRQNSIEEEIKRINLFNYALCISKSEMELIEDRMEKTKLYYFPVFLAGQTQNKKVIHKYDILFVGSNNKSNQRAFKWFYENVFPQLRNDLRILFVGTIVDSIPPKESFKKIRHIDDISEIYSSASVIINPMTDGTGMKVKLIEALAYGKPVISTSKGVSGLSKAVIEQLIVTDEPSGFADWIHKLIDDDELYMKFCNISIEIFQTNFSTETAYKVLDNIFMFAD